MWGLCSSIHSLAFPEGHQLTLSEALPQSSLGKRSLGHLSRGHVDVIVPSSTLSVSVLFQQCSLRLCTLRNLLPSLPKKCHDSLSCNTETPCGGLQHSFHSVPVTPSWKNVKKWHRKVAEPHRWIRPRARGYTNQTQ